MPQVMTMTINGGLFLGHSLYEGAGNALGEDDISEIITGVIKCSAQVSGTPAQACIQEREGKKPSPETTGADEPKGDSQTFPEIEPCKLGSRAGGSEWGRDFRGSSTCQMWCFGTLERQLVQLLVE